MLQLALGLVCHLDSGKSRTILIAAAANAALARIISTDTASAEEDTVALEAMTGVRHLNTAVSVREATSAIVFALAIRIGLSLTVVIVIGLARNVVSLIHALCIGTFGVVFDQALLR